MRFADADHREGEPSRHCFSGPPLDPTRAPAAADSLLVRVDKTVMTLSRHSAPALQPYERERVARYVRESDARDYQAAHLLAREVVASLTGTKISAVEFVQTCGYCGAVGHGRPSIVADDSVSVSWSHTRGVVAAAAARAHAVGVDVEGSRGWTRVPRFIDAAMTPAEAAEIRNATDPESAFLRLWTRKESMIKIGTLSLDRLADVSAESRPGVSLTSWYDEEAAAWIGLSVVHQDRGDGVQ